MTEENKVLEEEFETKDISEEDKDILKDALEEQFKKIRTQNLLLGAQTMAQVILEKMIVWEKQPGKRTLNDHRRLIKDIKQFCEVGLSKQVNPDGTISAIEDQIKQEGDANSKG